MINEDYVSFEVAKLLKEKGFDEKVSTHYLVHPSGFPEFFDKKDEFTEPEDVWLKCPTHQMAMKWLREVHNIFIEISTSIDLNGDYHFSYTILNKECKYVRRGYTFFDWSYEDAVEAALEYCLEILI